MVQCKSKIFIENEVLSMITDAKWIRCTADIGTVSPDFRKKLVELLKEHKGKIPLTMYLHDPEKGWNIEFLARKFTVAVTDQLINDLHKMGIMYNVIKK